MAMSQQALDEFKAYRADEENYSGPMDALTYKVLTKMADTDTVQRLFKTVTAGGKTYTLFSLYLVGSAKVQDAIDEMTAKWPTHFIVVGAWHFDGRQVGTQWELDEEGEPTGGVTGTPVYPIPATAYRIMPDTVTYDENGDELTRVPASSNADLRDINLWSGQTHRRFT